MTADDFYSRGFWPIGVDPHRMALDRIYSVELIRSVDGVRL